MQQIKSIQFELKWAVIFIVTFLLWMWGEKLAGLHDIHIDQHAQVTNYILIPALLVYVLALYFKKKTLNGSMSFSQGFKSAMLITIFITLLTPLMQYIISYIISPLYFQNASAYAVRIHQFETIEDAKKVFNFKTYAIQSTIGSFGMGIILSVVVAFVMKSRMK